MRSYLSLVLLPLALGCAGSTRSTPPGHAGDDARDFVRENRAELEKEIRRGSGQRIYDLAILANCQDVWRLSRRLNRQQDQLFGPAPGGEISGDDVSGSEAPGSGAAAQPVDDAEVGDRIVRLMTESRDLRCLELDTSRQRMFAAGTRHIGPTRAQVYRRGGTP